MITVGGKKLLMGVWLLSLMVGLGTLSSSEAKAAALQIRPLSYPHDLKNGPEKLKPGETKKGFVDVSNASHSATSVTLKVQGFKQVDDQG
ncbi:hypothetical protein CYG49_01855, partial [Candidatus Saccharibacteria bacterium]